MTRPRCLRTFISTFAGILLSLVLTGESVAYVVLSSHWSPPVNNWNLGGFDATNQAAFIQAMNTWNEKSNFSFTNSSLNISPCDSVASPDNQSGVKFDSDDCGRGFGETTLAVTWTWSTGSDTLDTDMVFNTKYVWGIHDQPAGSGATIDFRRVSVHELGHALGLGHETSNAAIMQPIYGDVLGPLTDDINGMVAIYGATSPPSPLPSEDDLLLMVMPPVLAAVQSRTPTPPPPSPAPAQWGVLTQLCCPSSSNTYKVIQGSQSRSSTAATSCSSDPTFSGYLSTTAGSKFFSHNVSSSGCADLAGSGSASLEPGKRYLWVAELVDGNPQFNLYSADVSSASGSVSATNYSNRGTTDDMVIEASGPLILEQDGDGLAAFQRLERPRALP